MSNSDLICPNCQMGRLDLQLTTFIQLYGETLVSVPNTPAWVCDICHSQQIDPESIQRLELLIGQTGAPPNRYQPISARRKLNRPDPKAALIPRPKARLKVNKG